jgi:hypothetical protein
MKKILALISMLIVAAACTAPPTNQPVAETNRNANVAPDASAAAITEADATAKEKAIWDTIKQKNYTAFADMLADDQVEVLSDGVHDKAASVAGVKDFEPSEMTFTDWKFLPLNKDGFLVAYTVAVKGKYKGKDFPLESMRCSSAWVRRAGKWLAVFHQESPLKAAMAPPPASKAKPEASPAAAKPEAPTISSDPIANEKTVWDLFKAKNYDGFAGLLASDFLEVEPDGYYDKAGSVKGVSMFDASKAVLSDFKSMNLDANTALVTYMVKNPGFNPKGERHSTIYVNRDGKWLGLFHHGGTPVEPPAPATAAKPAASPAAK